VAGAAGTSIGAVVGGMWAAGLLDAYEEFVRGLELGSVLWFLDPTLPRSGLVGGNRLWSAMGRMIGDRRIEDLPRPFRAITAELFSGDEVRVAEGSLTEALRASTTIPGLFPPVRLQGRWMVDGGLAAPVPVTAARELGEGLVLAVDLNSRSRSRDPGEEAHEDEVDTAAREGRGGRVLQKLERWWSTLRPDPAERPPGILTVVHQGIAQIQARLTRLQLEREPPDLLLQPSLPDVSLLDFHKAAPAIAVGRACAEEMFQSGAWDRALEDWRRRHETAAS